MGGAEARANSNKNNRVQLVGRVAWVCVGGISVQGGKCFQVGTSHTIIHTLVFIVIAGYKVMNYKMNLIQRYTQV